MKIGIFGDSFADPRKLNPSLTWIEILAEKYDVTNHAIAGSNLYFSITEIKKYHTNYDKIIFVVTNPGRLKVATWLPLDIEQQFIVPTMVKFLNKFDLVHYQKLAWEAAKQYYDYLQDINYDDYIHNLMLKDIKETVSNIILVPAFLDSWTNVNSAMVQITSKENKFWGLCWEDVIEKYKEDIRNCHMTAENNAIFASKVEEWLNNKPVHIDLNDFVINTKKDFYLKQK
jgi:hypothetical protein